jgi:tRNA pseudouridine55 synthase
MGTALGCGAHLKSLRRLACDHLSVAEAITLEHLELCKSEAEVPLIALHAALGHIRAVALDERDLSRLRLGQQEPLSQMDRPRPGERLLQIQDSTGHLGALAVWNEAFPGGRWQLFRIFTVDSQP